MKYTVTIPEWENSYLKSKEIRPVYWFWKDKLKLPKKHAIRDLNTPLIVGRTLYCQNELGERFLRNTLKVGKENRWILNGQDLYNAVMDWRLRKSVALYYHKYFSRYILEQLSPIPILEGFTLSISCEIYEIKRSHMPDVSNMWLLEKFFEDALQDCKIIPDDGPDFVQESGRKRYRWVTEPEERKLVFTVEHIK